ncbi:class I SAM-dependent methyltransferase [Hymenobacter sp. BT186]|uniref:Class I SAM-dependent methyltransferase n=1 Tax=Hymenobacter telluris TaxID=2816474 RepID=A0A939JAP2_9BACT|nr:class I SAM-dependent methyltransferase [Hymenobacter telluris]MBO0360084.1 class I SAM-dependent methyltransferase [Hymenobacter telluris]MBW3376111.1 class I SAM-dependent methyltransferase [Hymenobacter norwichensis]
MLDRFSAQAAQYARYRIDYPPALYEFLLAHTSHRERAWDCATGNGQVAAVLAEHFEHVAATDISEAQLAQAPQRATITYQVSPAERTPFPATSVDLITVAQAVHWFDAAAFNQEVRRVARPGATVAEWGYGLVQVHETIDPLVRQFYAGTMRPYWDENRWHIDDEYARIPFPFEAVQHAHFQVRRQWSAEWFLNYLRTWSSVVQYEKQHGQDPVLLIADELTARWGPAEREIVFPVFLRLGRVE